MWDNIEMCLPVVWHLFFTYVFFSCLQYLIILLSVTTITHFLSEEDITLTLMQYKRFIYLDRAINKHTVVFHMFVINIMTNNI
jgi:hypothetical protein